MATILLSAAGAAIGSGIGGTALGLSGAVIGRAVGATVGRSIDQRIFGSEAEPIETGRVDRFQLSSVGYGTPIKQVWGRMRLAGEVIWASRFLETRTTSGGQGGKGTKKSTQVTEQFSYTVSIAIALCRGEALRVGRFWANGIEIDQSGLNWRFYSGTNDQLPDPKIEAVEGAGFAPAYRGICYVVIEDLPLSRFGNRVPQFSFEVVRRAQGMSNDYHLDLPATIRAVSLIPGTGEYALATTPVHYSLGIGTNQTANVHSIQGGTDLTASLTQLDQELPNCGAVSLVVSWFGNDLRCSYCEIRPKVEQYSLDGVGMPWTVSGLTRSAATLVPREDDRPIYGGTPTDQSVIEAIRELRALGKEVMFYPFILMDQWHGNQLPDPWTSEQSQPVLPWRGRITLSHAPGQPGSPDQTSYAEDEILEFMGSAGVADFQQTPNGVEYHGPTEWSYRRFILHYANLCAVAGGVESFCIGSEMRGLTQARSALRNFPMVDALKSLASEVKSILGNNTKVSYAADWSEYFGLRTSDSVFFNLDPLWSDPNIDFVGIDNYMPISDWRDFEDHADSAVESIYNLEYLMSGVVGGEGYDWYYEPGAEQADQVRISIQDYSYGEDWVFRYKDIKNWWSNDHHDRIDGVRDSASSGWIPGMKPIRFTEYGCAALNRSTNQPNLFIDPKSSESSLPRSSNGRRDDFLQMQYFNAMAKVWNTREENPEASLYSGTMVDLEHCFAWAWDSRPFPEFPGNLSTWSDGASYGRGHWLNGRSSSQPLGAIIGELVASGGLEDDSEIRDIAGVVGGYLVDDTEKLRTQIQRLSMSHGFDVFEFGGVVKFATQRPKIGKTISVDSVLRTNGFDSFERNRGSSADETSRIRLIYVESAGDFELKSMEASQDRFGIGSTSALELPLLLSESEANIIGNRLLSDARLIKHSLQIVLPMSRFDITVGDVVNLHCHSFKVDRLEQSSGLTLEASYVGSGTHDVIDLQGVTPLRLSPTVSTSVFATFMDLPLLRGDEVPYAPRVAVYADPWPGNVAIWSSSEDFGYTLSQLVSFPTAIGYTETALGPSSPCLWDRGSHLRVRIDSTSISSAPFSEVLNGSNLLAIGDGSVENWEVFQFSVASVVGDSVYELSSLLRGLGGSDSRSLSSWPTGSLVVILGDTIQQLATSPSSRGLDRFYRIGDVEKGIDDAHVNRTMAKFEGVGLRPLSVCHVKSHVESEGDVILSWVRRTRVDGDSWGNFDVPIGEEREVYAVEIFFGGRAVRNQIVESQSFIYTMTMQITDGVVRPFSATVGQVSASVGVGPLKTILIQ